MCHQRIKNRSEKTFQFVIGHDLGPANLNSFFPAQTTTLFHVVLYLCVFLLKLSVSEWRVILICVALFVAFLWGTVRLSISFLLKQTLFVFSFFNFRASAFLWCHLVSWVPFPFWVLCSLFVTIPLLLWQHMFAFLEWHYIFNGPISWVYVIIFLLANSA